MHERLPPAWCQWANTFIQTLAKDLAMLVVLALIFAVCVERGVLSKEVKRYLDGRC